MVDEVPQPPVLEERDAQPSAWWSVRPPRCAKPVKLKVTSVGVLQFIPSNWHMAAIRPRFAQPLARRALNPSARTVQRYRRNRPSFVTRTISMKREPVLLAPVKSISMLLTRSFMALSVACSFARVRSRPVRRSASIITIAFT